MQIFEYVLIMLAAVLLSNLVNRFIPVFSVPIVQIALGVVIALIPFGAFGFNFELEPDLFFVLFLAPLVFYSSMNASKRTLWDMKGPIITTALILVFLTVIVAGYFVHAFVPGIPLAAAFAMIAALGPTDVVAVSAATKRVAVPQKIMGILSGESIINDASGIVSFQFAILAVTTGAFSIPDATGRFLLLSLGGIVAGLIMTFLKYYFVKWLRSLGMENVTLHILIDILTPFIVYMVADTLHLSGILAVFASGIVHSILRDKFNPETVKLNISRDSVWSMLSFSFDGLVFVILGTQLPRIIENIGDEFSLIEWRLAGYILLITLIIAAIRFAWWTLIIGKKADGGAGVKPCAKPNDRIRSGLIFSLSGARGTVSLACVMSIPLLLSDGSAFPGRDLIIFISSGVIVTSLLLTNFVLPLFAERKTDKGLSEAEQTAYAEIIQTVISRLLAETTDENRFATQTVIRSYSRRNTNLKETETVRQEAVKERELLLLAREWEKENTAALLGAGTIDEDIANRYLEVVDSRLGTPFGKRSRSSFSRVVMFAMRFLFKKNFHEAPSENTAFHERVTALTAANNKYVLEKLNAMKDEGDGAVDKLISWYELSAQIRQNRDNNRGRAQPDISNLNINRSSVFEIAMRGFEIERGLIQEMFEDGRLSRETVKEMRGNIALLEAQLQAV